MSAVAAGPVADVGGFSLVSSVIQMAASLAVVIGVILLFHYFSKRWLKGRMPGTARPGYIRIVENRFLAPKKSLMLVEVGGEYMLLGSCGDTINLIKQIDMIEEVEVIGEAAPVPFREAFQEKLKNLAARFPVGTEVLAASLKRGGLQR
jgi:flagellar protein FliO/FliZ